MGAQYLDNTGSKDRSLPSYHVASLRLSYDLPVHSLKAWRLNLQVNNLLDAKYASNGYAYYTFDKTGAIESSKYVYPQAGIHVFVGSTITL